MMQCSVRTVFWSDGLVHCSIGTWRKWPQLRKISGGMPPFFENSMFRCFLCSQRFILKVASEVLKGVKQSLFAFSASGAKPKVLKASKWCAHHDLVQAWGVGLTVQSKRRTDFENPNVEQCDFNTMHPKSILTNELHSLSLSLSQGGEIWTVRTQHQVQPLTFHHFFLLLARFRCFGLTKALKAINYITCAHHSETTKVGQPKSLATRLNCVF